MSMTTIKMQEYTIRWIQQLKFCRDMKINHNAKPSGQKKVVCSKERKKVQLRPRTNKNWILSKKSNLWIRNESLILTTRKRNKSQKLCCEALNKRCICHILMNLQLNDTSKRRETKSRHKEHRYYNKWSLIGLHGW